MAKLFDLTEEGKQLEKLIENLESSETGLEGESEKILYDALLKNEEDLSKKLGGIVFFIKEALGEAESRKKLAQELQKAQKAKENRAKSLKGLLKFFLDMKGLKKHKAGDWTVRLQDNPGEAPLIITRKEIEEGDQAALAEIPSEYVQVKLSLTFDPNDQEALAKLPPEFVCQKLELKTDFVKSVLQNEATPDPFFDADLPCPVEDLPKIDFAELGERGQHVRID
jgi:hypothetical protein